jgi:hypothetical protein
METSNNESTDLSQLGRIVKYSVYIAVGLFVLVILIRPLGHFIFLQ